MGGARTTVRSVQKRRQRAGTSEQVLGLREGVFRLAQQGPRDPGVGSCGQHEDVAEQRGGLVPPAVLQALRAAHRRGARIAAICTGAFVLAQAGLLDGRRATTHWRRAAQFATAFPAVQVDPDVLYVDHGDVATSAGTGTGIDLCLHLVRCDYGSAYANQIARSMVLPPAPGGQPAPVRDTAQHRQDRRVAGTAAGVGHLAARHTLTLGGLATRTGLSSRTLARRFAEQLGTTPGQWLLGQRLDAARTLLEQTDLPVEAIATRVGLASAVNLRRRFRAALGTTPGAYRRAFGESPTASDTITRTAAPGNLSAAASSR